MNPECEHGARIGDACPFCDRRAEARKEARDEAERHMPRDIGWSWPVGKTF